MSVLSTPSSIVRDAVLDLSAPAAGVRAERAFQAVLLTATLPTFVFLHAWVHPEETWTFLAPILAALCLLTALGCRGEGGSQGTAGATVARSPRKNFHSLSKSCERWAAAPGAVRSRSAEGRAR